MIKVSVKLLGEYREFAGDSAFLELEEGSVVSDLIDALFSLLGSGFRDCFADPCVKSLSERSLILVGGVEIGAVSGLETLLCHLDEVQVIPVSHGG